MTVPTDQEIAAVLQGEATAEVQALVEAWKRDHPDEFEQARWILARDSEIIFKEYDVEEVLHKLSATSTRGRQTISRSLRWVVGVAASMLLLCLGYWSIRPDMGTLTQLSSGSQTLVLSDGSQITLREGATLSYPQTFSGAERRVVLQGDAFFDIAEDPDFPFVITSDLGDIKVLGTSFDVSADSVELWVKVETGRVQLTSTIHRQSVVLDPGNIGQVSTRQVQKFDHGFVNLNAWRTGRLDFADSPLAEVVSDLRRYYGDSIYHSTSLDFPCRLTASFDQAALQEVMQVLEISCQLEIERRGNRYHIFNQ